MEESPADVSKLVKAVSLKDYVSAKAWIVRNEQFLASQEAQDSEVRAEVRGQIGKIVRAAAFDGQVDNVEYFRWHG